MTDREVVHRIEDGMDRQQVAATTYQQRNVYTQFRDGFFHRNELMNYLLHHWVALQAGRQPTGTHLLDVCCGRGLLLPLLRYHAKELGSYTGLDIKAGNATWRTRRVTTGEPLKDGPDAYYPWPTHFVEGNVARADELVGHAARMGQQPASFGMMVYTASIEHMHPEDGRASLHALRRLATPDATMILTCPNTPPDENGYNTRYRAHVYEWSLPELRAALAEADWIVEAEWGIDMGVREMGAAMEAAGYADLLYRIRRFVPQEWAVPVLAALFPKESSEVGLLCRPKPAQNALFS